LQKAVIGCRRNSSEAQFDGRECERNGCSMMSLSKLRSQVRRVKAFRDGWAGLRLVGSYLASLPDWFHWLQLRRTRRGKSRQTNSTDFSGRLHIAFVTRYARAREFKLAHAARLYGHRVTLIAMVVQSPEMVAQHFDAYYQARNVWQILTALDDLQADVAHLFVNYNNIEMLPILLFAKAPVVYDPYDCMRGMFRAGSEPPFFELIAERIGFAYADHICARSLEPLYLRRHYGYHMPATTYFPEYCWQPPARRELRPINEENELHVVYCGGVWPEDRFPPAEYGYAQYIEVGRVLAEQRVHLHIYPAPTPANTDFESFFALYLAETERNSFFHLHRPLPYEELMRVLPQYDAAMHIMGVSINENLGRATRSKLDYSTANKLFDYIEAGLPVIVHNGKHQRGLVRHYGYSVEISDLSALRTALRNVNMIGGDKSATADIGHHAHRLNRMYQEVAKKCAS